VLLVEFLSDFTEMAYFVPNSDEFFGMNSYGESLHKLSDANLINEIWLNIFRK